MNLKSPRTNAVISVEPDHAQAFLSQGWTEHVEAAPEAEPERPKCKRAAAKS